MDCIENGMHRIYSSSTGTHKSFLLHYVLWGGGDFLKRILTCLYCIKYNKTDIRHSDKQKKVSCKNF